VRSRHYVPWRDPAPQAITFQNFDYGVGDRRILRGVADEYVGRGGLRASSLPLAVAFSHVDLPPTSTLCWQMIPAFIKVYWERTVYGSNGAFGAGRLKAGRSGVGRLLPDAVNARTRPGAGSGDCRLWGGLVANAI
jgi:hypothetical protein